MHIARTSKTMKLARHFAPAYTTPVDRLASELFGRDITHFFGSDDVWARSPKVNIIEGKDDFRIDVQVPGFAKEDLKLNVEDGMLTISAERSTNDIKENERYTRREFGYTKFQRSFRLPEGANNDRITAEHVNGVLSISIPKNEESKPRTREISIN